MSVSTVFQVLSAEQTADLLPYRQLVMAIRQAARDYRDGHIQSPERQVLTLPEGGFFSSMPATSADIAIHKQVNFCAANLDKGLPSIHGLVSVWDAPTGQALFAMDGPTVTARRTASVSMAAIEALGFAAGLNVAIIGGGKQAAGHLEALAALYPGTQVAVHDLNLQMATRLCEACAHLPLNLRPAVGPVADEVTVLITVTSSSTPVYSQAARAGRLIVGVGAFRPEMAEIAPAVVLASRLFVDDPEGARHEAGDYLQAGVDWQQVTSLADALELQNGQMPGEPVMFKSVGSAAWDLAAGRCAMSLYGERQARKAG